LASAAFLRGGFRHPATILFSAQRKEDLYEIGLYNYLKVKFRNFDFKYTLTQDANPGGLTGRIPEILPDLFPDLSNYSVYIAGSPDFVEACAEKAITLGLQEDRLHKEGFFEQGEPQAPSPDRLR